MRAAGRHDFDADVGLKSDLQCDKKGIPHRPAPLSQTPVRCSARVATAIGLNGDRAHQTYGLPADPVRPESDTLAYPAHRPSTN